MRGKSSPYARRVVKAGIAGEDGWAEFWLECGHGGRILIGKGQDLSVLKITNCGLCRKEQATAERLLLRQAEMRERTGR